MKTKKARTHTVFIFKPESCQFNRDILWQNAFEGGIRTDNKRYI